MNETDVLQMETSLMQLPEISSARIILTENGEMKEVHIVGTGMKDDKHLARDANTLLQTTFGIDFDYRMISVVQFARNGTRQKRASIEEISTDTRGINATVKVTLAKDLERAQGEAKGAATGDNLMRLAATATLEALTKMVGKETYLALGSINVQRTADQAVAVATVRIAGKDGTVDLSGSAVVVSQEVDAVARAILDAVNRKLWRE